MLKLSLFFIYRLSKQYNKYMLLTKQIADEIINYYEYKECVTNEDINACIDAHMFLAEVLNEYQHYSWIGGYYYEIKRYDLALKYYLKGDAKNIYNCTSGLGYIFYYGRNGEVDYKKLYIILSVLMKTCIMMNVV